MLYPLGSMTNWIRFHDELIISCWYIFFWNVGRMGRLTNISIFRPKKMIDDKKRLLGKIWQIDVKQCFFAHATTVILFLLLHITRKLFVSTRRSFKILQVQLGFQSFSRIQSWLQAATLLFFNTQNIKQYHKEIVIIRKKAHAAERQKGEESERKNCVWTKVSVT